MKTVLKTYEVSYILGAINPEEKKIKISTINQLTESFIREEIERLKPNHKGFIISILSTILVDEKVLVENKETEEQKGENNPKDIPVFNW